jgi:anti-sigma factor RsiW
VSDWSQFGKKEGTRPVGTDTCAVVETLLPDAVDGSLSPSERAVFDRHLSTCTDCARELEEAQRGAAWLSLLKDHAPDPPAALLEKILADTTGTDAFAVPVPVMIAAPVAGMAPVEDWQARAWAPRPARSAGWWVSIRKRFTDATRIEHGHANFHPRFAMTAAMAFFSIALSLNLSGIRLRDLRAENFTPSGMRRAVVDASASAQRRFQNLRVVYQMESRVNELRTDTVSADDRSFGQGAAATPAPAQNTNKNAAPEQQKQAAPEGQQKGHDDQHPRGSSHLRFPNPVDSRRRAITEVIS